MFNRSHRIQAFIALGEYVSGLSSEEFRQLAIKAKQENGWFDEASVSLAFAGIKKLLDPAEVESWVAGYDEVKAPRTVGVAMAGNIPLVGFHDFLAVLISGHRLKYKPSSKDTVLLNHIQAKLIEIEPRFANCIERAGRLTGVDAMIATGSDNSARYFEYYFRNVPHIIRRNRSSCGVIQGDEPEHELAKLGADIFSYYGLGCRNVALVLVPAEFDLHRLMTSLNPFESVRENHKYVNNYTYQKSLLMLNQEKFLDNGFVLLKQDRRLNSPIALIHYAVYNDQHNLRELMAGYADSLQVVVSAAGWLHGSIPFGTTQLPGVTDYADGVDTMKFLACLG